MKINLYHNIYVISDFLRSQHKDKYDAPHFQLHLKGVHVVDFDYESENKIFPNSSTSLVNNNLPNDVLVHGGNVSDVEYVAVVVRGPVALLARPLRRHGYGWNGVGQVVGVALHEAADLDEKHHWHQLEKTEVKKWAVVDVLNGFLDVVVRRRLKQSKQNVLIGTWSGLFLVENIRPEKILSIGNRGTIIYLTFNSNFLVS